MDIEVLRKKISTFRGPAGRVRNVSDDLLVEILSAWENWSGPSKGFYSAIGVSAKGMASMLGKAKKLKREGHFPDPEFKEIKIEEPLRRVTSAAGITLRWSKNRVIRFADVDQLVEFLTKTEEKKAS